MRTKPEIAIAQKAAGELPACKHSSNTALQLDVLRQPQTLIRLSLVRHRPQAVRAHAAAEKVPEWKRKHCRHVQPQVRQMLWALVTSEQSKLLLCLL